MQLRDRGARLSCAACRKAREKAAAIARRIAYRNSKEAAMPWIKYLPKVKWKSTPHGQNAAVVVEFN